MRRRTAGLEGVQGKEGVSPNSLADFLIGFQRLEPIFVKAIPTRSEGCLDRQFDSGAVSVFRFHGVRKRGEYMSEKEAVQKGYLPANGTGE
jgi:hypothetical protein